MLFNKKNRFQITERQIKEDIKNSDGVIMLKLNLRYPEIKCAKNDPLSKYAEKFYSQTAKAFSEYAKGDFLSSANTVYSARKEEFVPFSVVMRWECTFDNSEYLSIVTDFSVSDGINPPFNEKQTQVWSRKSGTKCTFHQLFDKNKLKNLTEPLLDKSEKKYFDKELFALRDNNVEFYILQKDRYRTLSFPKENLLKTLINV